MRKKLLFTCFVFITNVGLAQTFNDYIKLLKPTLTSEELMYFYYTNDFKMVDSTFKRFHSLKN
jgi:hypothetical protein